jgi:amino acid transporter
LRGGAFWVKASGGPRSLSPTALELRPPGSHVGPVNLTTRSDAYHPRATRVRRQDRRLRVPDASAMAIGGMIGGGIFSVLGVAVALAGDLAAGCFVLGAVLSLMTARSWARVTARSGRSGGPFDHLREQGHPQLAGALLWLLVFGYMVAMAVYSFTFGRYVAGALGAGSGAARLLSIGVVVCFLGVNLRGVTVSSLTEDLVVAAKLVVLFGIAAIGMAHLDLSRLDPLAASGAGGLALGAATVFFAYEGFELICYDRDDMADPGRTLPRSLYLSIIVVAAVYVAVTIGSQMLVPDSTLVASKEAAFIEVGRAALGETGRWAAIAGAVLATGSAINATLFSTARLVRDAARAGELPSGLGRVAQGVPAAALAFIAAVGAAMAMLPGITTVIVLGSGSFLAVYAIVNYLEARAGATRTDRVVAWVAMVLCAAALGDLVVELARDDRTTFAVLVGLVAVLIAGRIAFVSRGPRASRVRVRSLTVPEVDANGSDVGPCRLQRDEAHSRRGAEPARETGAPDQATERSTEMKAEVGDKLVIRGHAIGMKERHATIVEVRGADGAPPYVVHWDDELTDEPHDHLFYPGPDADVEHVSRSNTTNS